MKTKLLIALLLLQCHALFAEDYPVFPTALHVFLSDGRVEAFPDKYVDHYQESNGILTIVTNVGQTFTYKKSDIDSVCYNRPNSFPVFTMFKFNNKYNDQVFTDCIGEINDSVINLTVAGIGKHLTPSFKISDSLAVAYIDGVRQTTKESRVCFASPVYYVLANPMHHILLPRHSKYGDVFTMQPYGNIVKVYVEWLTDKSTNVPRIDINTTDGLMVDSKEEYKTATISFDGAGVFPSMKDSVKVKGRGNTSWANFDKKPYRLKFEKKVKPFGMTAGKNWVLLANNRRASMLTTAIGMKVACMVGTIAPNHIVPVELYMNGNYLGNYNFTEKVGFSNNSIELKDESAAVLLELDSYYDEPKEQKFRSITYGKYKLPINVKEPEFSKGKTVLTLSQIEKDFNTFLTALKDGSDITPYVDVDYLARYLITNEVICNTEFMYPKSDFCYRESLLSDTSKYVFGPAWDLDYGFGYQKGSKYFTDWGTNDFWTEEKTKNFAASNFVYDLRYKSTEVDKAFRREWKKFTKKTNELSDFCYDYYSYVSPSLKHDYEIWKDGTNYEKQTVQADKWLKERIEAITLRLASTDNNALINGDVNGDNIINIGDVVAAICLILNNDSNYQTKFNAECADIDNDNYITEKDIVGIIEMAIETIDYTKSADESKDVLTANYSDNEMQLYLESSQPYTAFQLTLSLPEGVNVSSIEMNGNKSANHQTSFGKNEQGEWIIVGYSMYNSNLETGNDRLLSIKTNKTISSSPAIKNICFFDQDSKTWRMSNYIAQTSSINNILSNDNNKSSIMYNLHGHKIENVSKQTHTNIYIHNNRKVIK